MPLVYFSDFFSLLLLLILLLLLLLLFIFFIRWSAAKLDANATMIQLYKVNTFCELPWRSHFNLNLKVPTYLSLKPFSRSQFCTSSGSEVWLINTSGVFTISRLRFFSLYNVKTVFSSSCRSWLLWARRKCVEQSW